VGTVARKKRKRAHGEGSIDRRPDGRWRGRITVGRDWETGKPKRITVYGKTQGEVKDKLDELKQQIKNGGYVDIGKMTFAEWLDIWLEEYARRAVRPTTYDSYEYLIRVHIKPGLGGILLRDLQPFNIQKFYNEKLKEKKRPATTPKDKEKTERLREQAGTLSPSTIRHMHIVINQALKQALKEGKIPRNPAEAATPPKLVKKEATFLTIEEINDFLDRAASDPWYPAFLAALGTGMRLGELAALRWENVDFKNSLIHVKESVHLVKTGNKKGPKTQLLVQPPKSEKGRRTIPLPGDVTAELRKLKKNQAGLKLMLGQAYQDQGYVFAWPDGRMVNPSYLSRRFKKLIREAGREDISFHGLRHSYASALLAAGEHPKVVQELLGHATVSMTLDLYSHVAPDLKERAASRMNELLQRKRPSSGQEGI